MKVIFEWLGNLLPGDYRRGASDFCRGIGLIYLIALVSWWLQADLLIGENGLVPIGELLEFVEKQNPGKQWSLPNLFWITGTSSAAIHGVFIFGVTCALLVILGLGQGPALIGCWIVYLSFVITGDTFTSFQWDILLLECGVLAILVSSWRWREKWTNPPELTPRRQVALILTWFLAAKLMFLSGWVKLAWASPDQPEWWPAHTAMTFHYETQPIPTWSAWFMHQLPAWFQKASIWPMYFIELVLPFFIFIHRHLRAIAGAGFVLLMLLILLTGNYTFFNWLTIVLCLPLFADSFWPTRLKPGADEVKTRPMTRWIALGITTPILILLCMLNYRIVVSDLHRAPNPLIRADLSPGWLDQLAGNLSPYYLCSGYGLFRTMTTERPEIILQGSRDGVTWKTYDFKWKPDSPEDRSDFVAPHQPRVAWQLWFAALEQRFSPRSRNARWFQALAFKLLNGDPAVQPLFRENPFPDRPPLVIRAKLHDFEFTGFERLRNSGEWWQSKEIGTYLPEIRLNR